MVMRGSSRSSIETITAGGRARTYMAVIPTPLQTQSPPPLVLVLHGSNQTGAGVRKFSGHTFDELAARRKAIVVYPNAYKGLWNDARRSMQSPARKDNVDDVAFLAELIDHGVRQYGTSHVFAVGYSNGGQMAIRLAHEIPDRLRGLALIGATQPTPDNFSVADRYSPLPVLIIHGTRDPLVPYAGGVASLWGFRPRGSGLSAPQQLHTLLSGTALPHHQLAGPFRTGRSPVRPLSRAQASTNRASSQLSSTPSRAAATSSPTPTKTHCSCSAEPPTTSTPLKSSGNSSTATLPLILKSSRDPESYEPYRGQCHPDRHAARDSGRPTWSRSICGATN